MQSAFRSQQTDFLRIRSHALDADLSDLFNLHAEHFTAFFDQFAVALGCL